MGPGKAGAFFKALAGNNFVLFFTASGLRFRASQLKRYASIKMEELIEKAIFGIYVTMIIVPLLYSFLFLIKAILFPGSLPQLSSFFESPFETKNFNKIATKLLLIVMLIVSGFLIFFCVSSFFLNAKPFPPILNTVGIILFMVYYCCFTGLIYGLGKASGAGGSSRKVYKELLNIFTKK